MKQSRRNNERAAALIRKFAHDNGPPKVSKYAAKRVIPYEQRVIARQRETFPRPATFYTHGDEQ